MRAILNLKHLTTGDNKKPFPYPLEFPQNALNQLLEHDLGFMFSRFNSLSLCVAQCSQIKPCEPNSLKPLRD